MAGVSIYTKIQGQEKYRALSRRLREAGRGDLQRKLTRSIKREGDTALRQVKSRWPTIDVRSAKGGTAPPDRSTGLRARAAAATRIQVLQTGIKISVQGSKVDPRYGRSLTKGLNGLGRWRYPVFGRRANPQDWQQNYGTEIFYSTLTRHDPAWRRGIERAMDETARQIEGGP